MAEKNFWKDITVGGTEALEGQNFWRDRTFGERECLVHMFGRDRTSSGTEHLEWCIQSDCNLWMGVYMQSDCNFMRGVYNQIVNYL